MIRSNVTHAEALRRLVAEVKLLDAVEVGERWNQLGGVLAVAEGVLRDGVAAPWWLADSVIAYASSHEGRANCVISKAQFDNALPKNRTEYDVPLGRLAAPVAAQPAGAVPAQEPVAYRTTFNDFRHFSGATASGRDYVQFEKPVHDSRFFEGCDSLVITPLYAAPVAGSAAPSGAGWQPIETAPRDGTRFLGSYEGKVGFWHWQDDPQSTGRPVGWRDSFIFVSREGDGPTHWMPIPVPAITATKE